MNPGLSATATGVLPRRCTKSRAARMASVDVQGPEIASTSCIRATGLKKCRPRNRVGSGAYNERSRTDSAEVVEATQGHPTDSCGTVASAHRLASGCSATASSTISGAQSFRLVRQASTRWRTLDIHALLGETPRESGEFSSDSGRYLRWVAACVHPYAEKPHWAHQMARPMPMRPAPRMRTLPLHSVASRVPPQSTL